MITSKIATRALVAARSSMQREQRRGIIGFLTNYPDKVLELKKIQNAGGVRQGEVNPTWLKQPGDQIVFGVGCGIVAFGLMQLSVGYYRLSTGKGKMD